MESPQMTHSTTNISTNIDVNDPRDQDDYEQKRTTKTWDGSCQETKKHKKY